MFAAMFKNVAGIVFILLYCQGSPIFSPMPSLVRVPQQDSAIIQSDRVGGNFAYSTVEGHAYVILSPIVENGRTQIGVHYSQHPAVEPIIVPNFHQ